MGHNLKIVEYVIEQIYMVFIIISYIELSSAPWSFEITISSELDDLNGIMYNHAFSHLSLSLFFFCSSMCRSVWSARAVSRSTSSLHPRLCYSSLHSLSDCTRSIRRTGGCDLSGFGDFFTLHFSFKFLGLYSPWGSKNRIGSKNSCK